MSEHFNKWWLFITYKVDFHVSIGTPPSPSNFRLLLFSSFAFSNSSLSSSSSDWFSEILARYSSFFFSLRSSFRSSASSLYMFKNNLHWDVLYMNIDILNLLDCAKHFEIFQSKSSSGTHTVSYMYVCWLIVYIENLKHTIVHVYTCLPITLSTLLASLFAYICCCLSWPFSTICEFSFAILSLLSSFSCSNLLIRDVELWCANILTLLC